MKFHNISIPVIFFFLISMAAEAQRPKSFVELGAGLSIPLGDYAKTDFNDPESGFANSGFNFNLAYLNRLTYNFGVTGALYLNSNSVNQQAYRDEITSDTLEAPLTVSTRNWGGFGILAGPMLYFPLNAYFSLDFRALVGFYSVYSPEVIIEGQTEAGENFMFRLFKYNGTGFAWGAGTTVRMKFGSSGYFLVKGDYQAYSPQFSDIEWLDQNGEIRTTSFTQNLETVILSLGIGYAL